MEALIVTTDKSLREPLASQLGRWGYTAAFHTRPEEAAAVFRPARHALVIVDAASYPKGSEQLRHLQQRVAASRSVLLLVPAFQESAPQRPTPEGVADDPRQEADQALHASEPDWLDRILEESTNEIYVFDAETLRFVQANRRARENLGYSMAELRDMTPLDVMPGYTLESLEELIAPLRAGSQDQIQFSTLHRRNTGSQYAVDVSLRRSAGASPPVFVSIILDATERDHAEQALRESEARAQAILETTRDGIITIDERGTIESFNRAAEQIFGYRAGEIVGKNVRLLMPAPYRDAHDGYLQAYHTTGERKIIGTGREALGLRHDGTVFPIDLAVSEVALHDRHTFIALIRDLSEHKRLEREVLEVSAQEQQRLGQELHDGLGSHLTGIAMLCRAMARRLEKGVSLRKEEMEEIAELVQEGAQQARLLARGLSPVRVSDQGLQSALQELAANMQKLSGVPCLFRSEGDAPPQQAETALHLYRIAQEAVTNALKHAQARHIWIRLAFEPQAIRLTVQDDGVGLPETLPENSGIGYRVMQHRAHLIGATLHLENAASGGVTLSCIIPLGDSGRPATAALPNGPTP